MASWKCNCTINGRIKGVAHVVEQEYDAQFKFWYGALEVECNEGSIQQISANVASFVNREAELELDDGRSMTVYLQGGSILQDGEPLSTTAICYFVSHTPLFNKKQSLIPPGFFPPGFLPQG
jgi:hypothetical protein